MLDLSFDLAELLVVSSKLRRVDRELSSSSVTGGSASILCRYLGSRELRIWFWMMVADCFMEGEMLVLLCESSSSFIWVASEPTFNKHAWLVE